MRTTLSEWRHDAYAETAVNVGTYVSLAICVVGLLLATITLSIASAPGTRGLRLFSMASFCGAAYAASNAMLCSGSHELSRVGVRLALPFIGLHAASWFIYTARREGRKLFPYERAIVGVALTCGALTFVPGLLYRTDEPWVHGVPALGIRYMLSLIHI